MQATTVLTEGVTNAAGINVQGVAIGSRIGVDPAAPAGALGIMRHEIIHVTRNAALWGRPYGLYEAQEWRGLVAEARKDKATVARVALDYKDRSTIVQTEETVAEMYRLWMAKRDKQGPVAATLRKIMGFLEAMADALRGRGFQSAARTMERIARGDVGGRGPDGGALRDSAGRFVIAEAREAARDTEFAARIMAELAQVDDLFQNPLATGATLKAVFRCLIPDFDGAILSSEWRDAAVEALDHQIAQEAIRAVTTARQIALDQYDEGELTAAERDAEMDVLDNQIVQMAMRATKKARNAMLIRYDDGELTAAERDAELGLLDNRFAQMLHAGAIPPVGQTDLQSERWPLSPSARTVHDDGIEVSLDGLSRLQSAAADFAKTESTRIVRAVIEDMRDRPAQGTFGEVAARHMWDEYCWALQEGPFDDDEGWDDVRLGSLSGAFDEMVRILIEVEIDRLPHHAQVFLSSKAIDDDFDMEEDALGTVWMHGMVDLVLEELNRQAARRSLYLIGPDRASVIGSEVEGSGIVWSVMSDRREATDIVASHVDEMIDPKSDLSMLAEEMVDAFVAAAKGEVDETVAAEFFDRFEDQIREMLTEHDVLPDLEDMRAQLQEQMDR